MIEDYDNKKTQTKGKLVFSEFKKVDYLYEIHQIYLLK